MYRLARFAPKPSYYLASAGLSSHSSSSVPLLSLLLQRGCFYTTSSSDNESIKTMLWERKQKEPGFNPDKYDAFDIEEMKEELLREYEMTLASEAPLSEHDEEIAAQQAAAAAEREAEKRQRAEDHKMRRASMLDKYAERRKDRQKRTEEAEERAGRQRDRSVGVDVSEEMEQKLRTGTVQRDTEFGGVV
eukprot:PhM_4_TR12950/c0_g1_i1/m.60111